MKKTAILLISLLLVATFCACNRSFDDEDESGGFGAFLGASARDVEKLLSYDEVAIDLDEFDSESIARLKAAGVVIDAYLSVGALENYRSYYEDFAHLTFMDYEHWQDERWIDVSNAAWQNKLQSEAARFKSLGADNLFLDNYDVYYIAAEEYDGGNGFAEGIFAGLKAFTEALHSLDVGLLINSGTDFLERLNDENSTTIDLFSGYVQECVFSSIIDYDEDVFGTAASEDKSYYLSVIEIMKPRCQVYLLEYTKDDKLKAQVKEYCVENSFKYYISSSVGLV